MVDHTCVPPRSAEQVQLWDVMGFSSSKAIVKHHFLSYIGWLMPNTALARWSFAGHSKVTDPGWWEDAEWGGWMLLAILQGWSILKMRFSTSRIPWRPAVHTAKQLIGICIPCDLHSMVSARCGMDTAKTVRVALHIYSSLVLEASQLQLWLPTLTARCTRETTSKCCQSRACVAMSTNFFRAAKIAVLSI